MERRQLGQLDAPAAQEGIAGNEEGVGPLTCKSCESRIDLADGADVEDLKLQPESARGRLHVSHRGLGIRSSDEHGHTCCSGHQLTQEFQPLRRQLNRENIDTCQVAARPSEAGNKTELIQCSKPNAAALTICDASDRCLLVALSVSPR
jgi:hypothetical protein